MSKKCNLIFFAMLIIVGSVVPFVPEIVVLEFFFLLIPFLIIFIITLICLLIAIFSKSINTRVAVNYFFILPIFIISQIFSAFSIHFIQKFKCHLILNNIEKIKVEEGNYPEKMDLSLGISYKKYDDSYVLRYSGGFLTTERYHSDSGNWINIQ